MFAARDDIGSAIVARVHGFGGEEASCKEPTGAVSWRKFSLIWASGDVERHRPPSHPSASLEATNHARTPIFWIKPDRVKKEVTLDRYSWRGTAIGLIAQMSNPNDSCDCKARVTFLVHD